MSRNKSEGKFIGYKLNKSLKYVHKTKQWRERTYYLRGTKGKAIQEWWKHLTEDPK